MFFRYVTSKGHEYLLLVENYRLSGHHHQRVIYNFGRKDFLDCREVFAILTRYPGYRYLTLPCGRDGCPPSCHHVVKTPGIYARPGATTPT